MCYNYAKATRAISYATPAYYADRLCDRGRVYLSNYLSGKQDICGPRQAHETVDAFYRRALNKVRQDNPQWQRSPGPWHADMCRVMFYL